MSKSAKVPVRLATLRMPGAWLIACLGVIAFVPSVMLKVFAIIPAVISGWLLVLRGATLGSHRLAGQQRRWFSVIVALAFPALASLYFLKDTPVVTFVGTFGHMASPWFLLPFALIALVSWAAADQIDEEHPVRGFLIVAAALWLLCAAGYAGARFSDDDDVGASYVDEEAPDGKLTGRYFGQFLIYVGIAYGVMIVKLAKNRIERRG